MQWRVLFHRNVVLFHRNVDVHFRIRITATKQNKATVLSYFGFVFNALHWMQGGLVAKKVSLCVSVCLSNAWIVTKRKKNQSRFLYDTKDHLAWFSEKKNGCWGRPLMPEILGQLVPVRAKSPILNRYSLVAPQPLHLAKKVQSTLIES